MQNLKVNPDIKLRCYKFSLSIINLTDNLSTKRSAFIIADQLVRSSTSVGANLVEARAASSRLEFKKFNEIALKSANETKYWLGLLRDSGLADKETINGLLKEIDEIAKMLAAGIIKLKAR